MSKDDFNRWPPAPLRRWAGRILQRMLNRVLALDPEMRTQLSALEGRRVGLSLNGPQLAFDVSVREGTLHVEAPSGSADLRLTTTPGSALAMALQRDGELPPGRVDIAGDADLARRIERLFKRFQPDFEAALTQRLGDVAGVFATRAFERVSAGARRHGRSLLADSTEWLREESRITPAPGEVEGFLDAVDALRERGDRLQARLVNIEAHMHGLTS